MHGFKVHPAGGKDCGNRGEVYRSVQNATPYGRMTRVHQCVPHSPPSFSSGPSVRLTPLYWSGTKGPICLVRSVDLYLTCGCIQRDSSNPPPHLGPRPHAPSPPGSMARPGRRRRAPDTRRRPPLSAAVRRASVTAVLARLFDQLGELFLVRLSDVLPEPVRDRRGFGHPERLSESRVFLQAFVPLLPLLRQRSDATRSSTPAFSASVLQSPVSRHCIDSKRSECKCGKRPCSSAQIAARAAGSGRLDRHEVHGSDPTPPP